MATETLGWRPFPTATLTHFVLGSHFATCRTDPHQKLPSTIPKKHDLYTHYLIPNLRVFRTNSVTRKRNEHYSICDRGSHSITRKYRFIFVSDQNISWLPLSKILDPYMYVSLYDHVYKPLLTPNDEL